MKLRIDALDTLFFRDGKPFTGGEDVWATMQFPPLPSVVHGALRTAYFAAHPTELDKAKTQDDPTAPLNITTIALESNDKLLFPIPLDCVKEKGSNDTFAFALSIVNSPQMSNCRMATMFGHDRDDVLENVEHGLFTSETLSNYLNGQEYVSYEKLSDYMVTEPKTGIGRTNETHVAQDGMLYRVEMRRLQGKDAPHLSVSLFVECEGIPLDYPIHDTTGLLRLGGEGKAATYAKSAAKLPSKPTVTGNRFKLYFATPAIFRHGWRPDWLKPVVINNTTIFAGACNNIELRLVTAIIGKPIFVGGFDMKEKRPKPMRKAVPAGSVYVFELLNERTIDDDVIKAFHGVTMSDYDRQQGFGLAYIGGAL